MNFMVGFLLAMCGSEEEAFWTFCGVVEHILPKDFFSPPPAPMNGFMVISQLVSDILAELYPDRHCHEHGLQQETFLSVVKMYIPKWFCQLWVTEVPLPALITIWDSIFGLDSNLKVAKGPLSIVVLSIACVEAVAADVFFRPEPLGEDDSSMVELYQAMQARMHRLTSEELTAALRKVDGELQANYGGEEALYRREATVKMELSSQWTSGHKVLALTRASHFSQNELTEIRDRYEGICRAQGSQQGLSQDALGKLLSRLPVRPPTEFAARVFEIYDTDESGVIDLKQLVLCLSCLYRGSLQERLRLCFEVFDNDNSGFLSLGEVESMASLLMQMLPLASGRVRSKSSLKSMLAEMDADGDKQVSLCL